VGGAFSAKRLRCPKDSIVRSRPKIEDARRRVWIQHSFFVHFASGVRDTVWVSAIPQPVRTTVEEYLTTSYRPDCDYVDGEIEERNVGEKEHSILQQALVFLFRLNREAWQIEVFPELRVQVAPTRYRVPDVTVVSAGLSWKRILRTAPLIIAEIASPEDRLRKTMERIDDYLNMGTKHVWLLDPEVRRGYVCSRSGLQEPEGGVLVVPGTPIRVVLSELFAELDRA